MINSNSNKTKRQQAWQRLRTALAAGAAMLATVTLGGNQPAQAGAYGGEIAEVALSGDGDTDVDLFIYDENGNLVAEDRDPGDDCLARWYVKRTSTYTIRVRNQGGVYNNYVIATN